MVGTARCAVRTPQRGVPTSEEFCRAPIVPWSSRFGLSYLLSNFTCNAIATMLPCRQFMPPKPHPQPPTMENWPTPAAIRKPSPPVSPNRPSLRQHHAISPTFYHGFHGIHRWAIVRVPGGSSVKSVKSVVQLFWVAASSRCARSCPVVPDQASIVLKRAKTRYFSRSNHAMAPNLGNLRGDRPARLSSPKSGRPRWRPAGGFFPPKRVRLPGESARTSRMIRAPPGPVTKCGAGVLACGFWRRPAARVGASSGGTPDELARVDARATSSAAVPAPQKRVEKDFTPGASNPKLVL